jgi:hypothetical protein
LDNRSSGHAGHGHDSSLEWAVTATASIGVHMANRGYAIRLVTDEGGTVSGAWHDSGAGPGEAEAPLLEALAVVESSNRASVGRWPDLLTGGEAASGLLIGVLGRLRPEEAAVVADVLSWTSVTGAKREAEEVRLAEAAQILRRAGWGVVMASRGESISAVWERLGLNRSVLPAPPPPADVGSSDAATTAGAQS